MSQALPEAPLTTLHVQRAIAGNRASLSWLVSRLSPLLLAQVAYRIGPKLQRFYDPQDLVQEAWLTALPRLSELTARDGRYTPVLLRFLSTTLLNKTNNIVKKHLRDGAPAGASGAAAWSNLVNECSGVVTAAIRKEARDVVTACIDALEERDREILLLRGIEQHPNQTVAMILGLTPQAVAMRYSRALARLREELPGSVFEELDD